MHVPDKVRDPRYYKAVEAGSLILVTNYGVDGNRLVFDDRVRKPVPDVYDDQKQYGVVVGILRDDRLLKLLVDFEEIVHLPFPETFDGPEGLRVYDPTHFRCFRRNRHYETVVRPVLWGGGLVHARSQWPVKTKTRFQLKRIKREAER